jgi:transcriptional regulator with XRE-family HTH domain
MNRLSAKKLAEMLKQKKNELDLTQEQLSELTGINRAMIGRIERMIFIPSIAQLESLATVLKFNITDLFVKKQNYNSFATLRSEAISEGEKEGVEKLFNMMLSLKQQIVLRSKFDNESTNRS